METEQLQKLVDSPSPQAHPCGLFFAQKNRRSTAVCVCSVRSVCELRPCGHVAVGGVLGVVLARVGVYGLHALGVNVDVVRLYFRFSCSEALFIEDGKVTSASLASPGSISLSVTVSLAGFDRAAESETGLTFDEAKREADSKWEEALSTIRINTDDPSFAKRFYSNLYHSLVKPADWSGESFIYGNGKPFVSDFITLWDMYKTELPLLFLLNREIGEKIVETLLRTGETLGCGS